MSWRLRSPQANKSMTPTDFAAEELAAWSLALDELHEAEQKAQAARDARDVPGFYSAVQQVELARQRAASLLAAAVEKKLSFKGARHRK